MKINGIFQSKWNGIALLILIHVPSIIIAQPQRHLHNGDYGTHMTALITTAMYTQGPILELGCGDYSTPLLHGICSPTQRKLISAESDLPWLSLFIDLMRPWHQFINVPESYQSAACPWDMVDPEDHYGMVFIDHAPALRRIEDIKRLRNKTDVFVVHDTEDSRYNFEPLLSTFKYKYVDTRYVLTTTVVSDTIDVTKFFNPFSTTSHESATSTKEQGKVEKVFTHIFEQNIWTSRETASGRGSELKVTKPIRQAISSLIKTFNITSIADAPCGDFNWMKHVDLGSCNYIGLDIVKTIIDQNTQFFASPSRTFKHLNLIEDRINTVDLIICRDLLAHLTNNEVLEVLRNFKKSGSKYLLVTTNTRVNQNNDISTGDWRLLNLEKSPFNFPKPLAMIEEDVPFELERGKCLGLWLLDEIKID